MKTKWSGILNVRKWQSMASAAGISKENLVKAFTLVKVSLVENKGNRDKAIKWLENYSRRLGGKNVWAVRARIGAHFLRNVGKILKNPRHVEYKSHLSQHRGPWKCTECGAVLKTDKAARRHKFNTGHSSFKSALRSNPNNNNVAEPIVRGKHIVPRWRAVYTKQELIKMGWVPTATFTKLSVALTAAHKFKRKQGGLTFVIVHEVPLGWQVHVKKLRS